MYRSIFPFVVLLLILVACSGATPQGDGTTKHQPTTPERKPTEVQATQPATTSVLSETRQPLTVTKEITTTQPLPTTEAVTTTQTITSEEEKTQPLTTTEEITTTQPLTTTMQEGDAAYMTIYGERLPDDAAPYELQTYKVACDIKGNQTTFDFQVASYQRICQWEGKLNDLFQDQLVTLDKDFNVIPASAEKWEMSPDGLIWTFHIKPGLIWSDGTPVTAHDWVATYRLIADPTHAWDFAWFYNGVIKHWDDVIAGNKPVEDVGVKAVDDLTLQFEMQKPQPAFPAMMQNSFVLQKKALKAHGPYYNSKVETSVSSGPFVLTAYEPGVRVEMEANPHYQGYRKPKLRKLIGEYRDMSTAFVAYRNREIDYVNYQWLTQADYQMIEKDPELMKHYLRHYGDFRTDYLFFDTYNPPFNDPNVRKAFAHAVDRESIVKGVFGEIRAIPAYGMLMPGFPASDTEGKLKQYQEFSCDDAKKYLSDAGFVDGKGFPPQQMWLRNESESMQAVYQAVAASIQQCLGVQIEVVNKDYKLFMDFLNAKPTKITFGAVSYGMDFLDASNMLGLWVSTGRHAWKNEAYDTLISEASGMIDNPQKRTEMFQEAEKILVDDVGAVFLDHRWQGDLVQPYLVGAGFRGNDSRNIAGWHWGNDWGWKDVYISNDVEKYQTYRDKE